MADRDPTATGKFIVFEGLDGAGTSTQIELLAAHLGETGIDVVVTREPTDGAVGTLVRQALRKEVELDGAALALLFAADRIDHLEGADGVKAALRRGAWVLSDRYVLSSIAYQASDDVDAAWVASINQRAITPDLTIYVETSPDVCMQRIEARGAKLERFETLERLKLVERHFRSHLGSQVLTGDVLRIDGDALVDAVAAEVREKVDGWR